MSDLTPWVEINDLTANPVVDVQEPLTIHRYPDGLDAWADE